MYERDGFLISIFVMCERGSLCMQRLRGVTYAGESLVSTPVLASRSVRCYVPLRREAERKRAGHYISHP